MLRQADPVLQATERVFQNTAIREARDAADMSFWYGNGNLRFRTKKHYRDMALSADAAPVPDGDRHLLLPGLDFVALRDPMPPHMGRMLSYHIVDTTTNPNATPSQRRYMLHIACEVPDAELAKTGLDRAIDRGITNPTVVVTTDGRRTTDKSCYDTVTSFRKNQEWNDQTRRLLSKMNQQSRKSREMRRRRKRMNRDNANRRDYAEWLLAGELCQGARRIILERLNIRALTRRGRHKRWINRGMRFVRHAHILRKVKVVAERLGRDHRGGSPQHQQDVLCVRPCGQSLPMRGAVRVRGLRQGGPCRRQCMLQHSRTWHQGMGTTGGRNGPRQARTGMDPEPETRMGEGRSGCHRPAAR